MPTPVGPLGPDEVDPHDPDLWDWDTPAGRPGAPRWVRATVWVVVGAFAVLAVASLLR